MSKTLKFAVVSMLFALLGANAWGQGIFATLTGVVTDPSQSVIAGAKITLTDTGSGSARDTVTNGDGYYTFASVPVGTYNLSVEKAGLSNLQGERHCFGRCRKAQLEYSLVVGTTSQTVEVSAEATPLVTTDSAEKSYTLEAKELQNMVQVGSDAAEYIKIMPGFAVQNGTSNKANYTRRSYRHQRQRRRRQPEPAEQRVYL